MHALTILYTSSETNSELQAKEAEQFAIEEGLEVEIKTVSSATRFNRSLSPVSPTRRAHSHRQLAQEPMGIVSQVAIHKSSVIGGENQLLNGDWQL